MDGWMGGWMDGWTDRQGETRGLSLFFCSVWKTNN